MSPMLRAPFAALALLLAVAAPAHAATELSSIFESVARDAKTLQVEPARPVDWFPVRGIVDFGEADARFGASRGGRAHEGQDVFAKAGTPLVSVRAGTVVETGDDGGRGNYIAIWSPAAKVTFVYLHMRAPARASVTICISRCARARAPRAGRSTRCRCCACWTAGRVSLRLTWNT